MTYKPDYGLRLLNDGCSPEVDHFFYDFRLYSLSILGGGRYSTMVEMPYQGELHALSLDFDQQQLERILSAASPKVRSLIQTELEADPISQRNIDIDEFVTFAVRARLGKVQKVERETFVPLVAQAIL